MCSLSPSILSASGKVSVCTDVPTYGYPSRVCSYRFCVRAFVIIAVYTHDRQVIEVRWETKRSIAQSTQSHNEEERIH